MAERFKTPEDALRLGARMRAARSEARFSLTYVADQTGVDPGQISKMERGLMVTLSPNVQKICTFLHVPAFPGQVRKIGLGTRIDALIAGAPSSEAGIAKLIGAIEELVWRGS
ncbi:XRE family transcriptional regulator [Lysobacter soli]|uniref:XRE family transcriptional regulator n=1 Tax=Lysobacter soli TaxID=453783 RepID=A0A3D8VBC3_9GAMM|nr:XRE family transcriptional regulator [Lysobacter soli]